MRTYMKFDAQSSEVLNRWPHEHALIVRLLDACRRLGWAVWADPSYELRNTAYTVRKSEGGDGGKWVDVGGCSSSALETLVLGIEEHLQKQEAA